MAKTIYEKIREAFTRKEQKEEEEERLKETEELTKKLELLRIQVDQYNDRSINTDSKRDNRK
jgi:hypothetical protein